MTAAYYPSASTAEGGNRIPAECRFAGSTGFMSETRSRASLALTSPRARASVWSAKRSSKLGVRTSLRRFPVEGSLPPNRPTLTRSVAEGKLTTLLVTGSSRLLVH